MKEIVVYPIVHSLWRFKLVVSGHIRFDNRWLYSRKQSAERGAERFKKYLKYSRRIKIRVEDRE